MFDNVRRVFGHLIVYGSADVAILVINVLLVPVYTRVLTPDEFGVLALLLLLEAFLRPFTQWGLDEAFLRFYYDCDSENTRRTLTGSTILFLFATNTVLLLVLVAGSGTISTLLLGSHIYGTAVAILAVNSAIAAFFFLPFNFLRIQNRPKQFATWTLARALGTVVARLVLVVGLRLGIIGIMLADLFVSTLLLLALTRVLKPLLAWQFSWKLIRDMLAYGLPRVPYAVLHQIMAMSDRFFLRVFLPLRDVGLYQLGSSVANVLKFYPVAFQRAWTPFSYEAMKRADAPQLFSRLATIAFSVLVFSTLGLAVFAEPLVRVLTPPTFHDAANIVPLLAFGVTIQAITIFAITSLNIAKQSRSLPGITLIAAVITVIGHMILIPKLGMLGAGLSVVIGQCVLAFTFLVVAQKHYRIPYEISRLSRVAGLGIVLYLAFGMAPQVSLVMDLLISCVIVACFPIGLLFIRVFDKTTIQEARSLLLSTLSKNTDDSPAI
ncbi:MAG: oligosaccharide flippase family protein [Acidobacteriota bacterium]|nr:oligosaccharide flippase family protein [Acidobacteriota bacterium]